MKFPKEFLLGASTAAHQVEGNNRYSDLWAQEQISYAIKHFADHKQRTHQCR